MNEEERIKLAYSRRRGDATIYSFFNPAQLFMAQELEREVIRLLLRHGVNRLADRKILEVGCGTGWPLRKAITWGARPENVCGIDILADAIEEARRLSPHMDLRCGNAETLPFEDGSFDVVIQFTMFTSILDSVMKRSVAKEMVRVLKSDGLILWYDYFISKPTNADVKGIGRSEVIRLFSDCSFDFSRVTLAPPIARAIAPYSFLLCYLLDKIPWLRTHYLVVIRKRQET
ncbi:MAG: class I SAM-dependent methyltransferase [Thermodesulfobacteriota bacterium]|nr:class I SAM-dependent methyltransferase [Thermodesulfobacteriota bacterium]